MAEATADVERVLVCVIIEVEDNDADSGVGVGVDNPPVASDSSLVAVAWGLPVASWGNWTNNEVSLTGLDISLSLEFNFSMVVDVKMEPCGHGSDGIHVLGEGYLIDDDWEGRAGYL